MAEAVNEERALRYPDLRSAGRALAQRLEAYGGGHDVIVLALARGGMEVALEVAKRLDALLDVVFIRRLLAPQGPDSQLCAVNAGGTLILDEQLPPRPTTPESALDYFLADALDDLARCVQASRGRRPAIDLARKTVLLVDNGIHSGGTMRAAIRALRKLEPARIVVAVPVAAAESRALIEALADEVVCLAWHQVFGHVGLWYARLTRPSEEEIHEMLEQAARGPMAKTS